MSSCFSFPHQPMPSLITRQFKKCVSSWQLIAISHQLTSLPITNILYIFGHGYMSDIMVLSNIRVYERHNTFNRLQLLRVSSCWGIGPRLEGRAFSIASALLISINYIACMLPFAFRLWIYYLNAINVCILFLCWHYINYMPRQIDSI